MEYILEQFTKNVKEGPNLPFLYDERHPNGITFAEFNTDSARVYAWLKSHGIGREDFVLIRLPRGVMPYIAAVGVWKAGAAYVIAEESYASERIAYIREDCGCKVELNLDLYQEMMNTPPLEGYEQTDLHDAAFAIYTSGTTGTPKGVLHEYGNLERCAESLQIEGNVVFKKGVFWAYTSPQSFAAAVIELVPLLCADHARMYIVPYATAKDPDAFVRLFQQYRFNTLFLPPSYARLVA